tara:strand:- start:35 stop:310 length:276 start_codon:yes stop_codon:yes gene_type:complete
MGKKKSRDHEVSKGERNNVSKRWIKAARNSRSFLEITLNKYDAYKAGKNVMLTVPNPNTNETNKPFIRVNAKDVWGSRKPYIMKQNVNKEA